MKYVLLATGNEKIDKALIQTFKRFDDVDFASNPVYFREGVRGSIQKYNPNVVIISDYLEGSSLSQKELIQLLRIRHPETRIIYLTKNDEDFEWKKFLYILTVYDVISIEPRLDISELHSMIMKGREWKDVAKFFVDLDPFEQFDIDMSKFNSDKNEKKIDDTYEVFGVNKKQNIDNQSLIEYVSVWSNKDQTGSSMIASNLSLLLSQNESDKILLVDFNLTNPNIHLHFSVQDPDGNRNLSAMAEDLQDNSIKKLKDILHYITVHRAFHNLHIIQGFTLKTPLPDENTISKIIQLIFTFAKQAGYSAVIFDTEPGIKHDAVLELLHKVTKIIFPITETPGSIISLDKFFDTEFGTFYTNRIDLNKLYPILNQSTFSDNTEKITQLARNVIKRKIYAKVPKDDVIFEHVSNGVPILKQEPSQKILREFIKIANCIHDIYVVPPVNPKRSLFKKR